jgi:solute:Na+ symporter, SSS family
LDIWWKLSGIFAGGMLGIFFLGFLSKNITNISGKIAVTIGILLIAWLSFKDFLPEKFQIPLDSKMTVVVGTVSIVLIGFGFEKLRKLFLKN